MLDHTPSEHELSDQVEELSTNVKNLRDTLNLKFFTARRAMAIAIIAMLLGFLATGSLLAAGWHWVNEYRHEQAAAAVVSCKNANAARAAIEDRIEGFGGQFIQALSEMTPATTGDAATQRQQFVDQATANVKKKLQETLPPELRARDCSPAAATSPTLVQR